METTSSNVITPRWVSISSKVLSLPLFYSSFCFLWILIQLLIEEWPIKYPMVDLNIYNAAGYFLLSLVLGLGFWGMKKWLLPVIALSFVGSLYYGLSGFGSDFLSLALIWLILLVPSLLARKHLDGSYFDKKNYLTYLIYINFIVSIYLIYISSPHLVY